MKISAAFMEQYRKSPRASFLDYNAGDYFTGDYFIAICTYGKEHFFGEIRDGEMFFSEVGRFLDNQLKSAAEICDYVDIPLYVVMPNHVHLIACICREPISENEYGQRAPNPAFRAEALAPRQVPILSRYVNSLKGAVTKFAKSNNIEFKCQPRYHDHCIRNQREANYISEYIQSNVACWRKDCFNQDAKL